MTTAPEIASIKRRFCAYLIDMAILLIPILMMKILLKDIPLVFNLSYIFIDCSYFTYFLSSDAQATPGQQLMNIHTINLNNVKINLSLAFNRSISQFFLPLLNNVIAVLIEFFQDQNALVDVLSILITAIILLIFCWYLVACLSKKKQTFHDMLFDTVVVKKD